MICRCILVKLAIVRKRTKAKEWFTTWSTSLMDTAETSRLIIVLHLFLLPVSSSWRNWVLSAQFVRTRERFRMNFYRHETKQFNHQYLVISNSWHLCRVYQIKTGGWYYSVTCTVMPRFQRAMIQKLNQRLYCAIIAPNRELTQWIKWFRRTPRRGWPAGNSPSLLWNNIYWLLDLLLTCYFLQYLNFLCI